MPAVRSRGRSTFGRDTNEPKPRSDAYTGLLLLALVAQVAGAVFLWMDYSQYVHKDANGSLTTEPPKVQMLTAGAPAAGPAVPAAQPAGNPVPAGNPAAPPAGNPMPPPANPMQPGIGQMGGGPK